MCNFVKSFETDWTVGSRTWEGWSDFFLFFAANDEFKNNKHPTQSSFFDNNNITITLFLRALVLFDARVFHLCPPVIFMPEA